MRRPRLSLGALGALVLFAAAFWISNGLKGDGAQTMSIKPGPSYTQLNDPKFQIDLMDKRVTELETKIATLQKQLAAASQHTHSYHAPQCVEFVSLLNLQAAINNPGAHSGMGVCLLRPLVGGTPASQTSAPGK